MIVKYQPLDHSWQEVWVHLFGSYGLGPWMTDPAKLYKGRTLFDWAQDLEELDPDVIDRAGRCVQAFGEEGVPYLILQAQKHPPGSEQRRRIEAFIRVPAVGH
jgi:hypothetical protein